MCKRKSALNEHPPLKSPKFECLENGVRELSALQFPHPARLIQLRLLTCRARCKAYFVHLGPDSAILT